MARVRANNASGGGGGTLNTEVSPNVIQKSGGNTTLTIPTSHKCAGTFQFYYYNDGGGNLSHTFFVYDQTTGKLNGYRQDSTTTVGSYDVTVTITDTAIQISAFNLSTSVKPIVAFYQYYV